MGYRKCPECHIPLNLEPLNQCDYHSKYSSEVRKINKRYELLLEQQRTEQATPIWQKLREADNPEDALAHLADWLEEKYK